MNIPCDTGLKLETLQKSVLVALDIFRKNIENRSIENKLEAWLFLLSSDEPERIMELLEKYPEFIFKRVGGNGRTGKANCRASGKN